MTNSTERLKHDDKSTAKMDLTKDNNNGNGTHDRSGTSTDMEKNLGNKKSTKTNDNDAPSNISELAEHYKDLQHYSNNDNDHHPIPSLPAVPHHAPPEDSSELLSPWWSEEPPDVTDPEFEDTNHNHNNHNHTNNSNSTNKADDQLSLYVVKFSRQATDNEGEEQWKEDCYLWSKEPHDQKESRLVDDLKEAGNKSKSTDAPSSPIATSTSQAKTSSSLPPPSSKQTYPLNSQCTMVCLFRESQQRKMKKRQDLKLTSSWNPFYGNWLVVSHTRSGFLEHIKETDIVKKTGPDYYNVELGERFGRTGEDVTKFMTRTFTPVQELGRRYIESWKDGTQAGFFTRFIESAKRGDAFFLLRDSARRIMENMMASDDKKKDDDDHKR